MKQQFTRKLCARPHQNCHNEMTKIEFSRWKSTRFPKRSRIASTMTSQLNHPNANASHRKMNSIRCDSINLSASRVCNSCSIDFYYDVPDSIVSRRDVRVYWRSNFIRFGMRSSSQLTTIFRFADSILSFAYFSNLHRKKGEKKIAVSPAQQFYSFISKTRQLGNILRAHHELKIQFSITSSFCCFCVQWKQIDFKSTPKRLHRSKWKAFKYLSALKS